MSSAAGSRSPDVIATLITGFDVGMGVRLVRTSADEGVVEYDVDARHLQPYGIVHGGMHCAMVETVCSMGAVLAGEAVPSRHEGSP